MQNSLKHLQEQYQSTMFWWKLDCLVIINSLLSFDRYYIGDGDSSAFKVSESNSYK